MKYMVRSVIIMSGITGALSAHEEVVEQALTPVVVAEAREKQEVHKPRKKKKKKGFKRFVTMCLQFLEKEIGKAVEKEAVHLLEQAPKLLSSKDKHAHHRALLLPVYRDHYRVMLHNVFDARRRYSVNAQRSPLLHKYLELRTTEEQQQFLSGVFAHEEQASCFVVDVVRALVDTAR